jgi:cell division septum initiation protein DivIVA
MTKRFSIAPLGYDRQEVQAAFDELVNNLTKIGVDRDKALSAVKDMEAAVLKANTERDEVLAQKQLITETLMNAQSKAAEIIEDATKEAVVRKQQLDKDIVDAEARLCKINSEITSIKKNIANM